MIPKDFAGMAGLQKFGEKLKKRKDEMKVLCDLDCLASTKST